MVTFCPLVAIVYNELGGLAVAGVSDVGRCCAAGVVWRGSDFLAPAALTDWWKVGLFTAAPA